MAERPFLSYELRRAQQLERALAARRQAIEAAAHGIAAALVARHRVRRVTLFGSAAAGEVSLSSDVDLAVEGLPPGDEREARLTAERAAGGVPFHLLRVEDVGGSLRRAILEQGRVLFDRPRAPGR